MEILYRFFDSNNRLLYVGISNNWTNRLNQHYKNSEFFAQVRSMTFEHFETREAVEEAERNAILTENPIYNKAWNPNWENSQEHFQKIKAWVYSKSIPDSQHKYMIERLRELFIADPDWVRKNSAPIAFYLTELLPVWDDTYNMDCQWCRNFWDSNMLLSWATHYREKKYNAVS